MKKIVCFQKEQDDLFVLLSEIQPHLLHLKAAFFSLTFAISDGHSLAVLRPHGLRLTNEQQTSQPTGDGHEKISGSSLFRDILTKNV